MKHLDFYAKKGKMKAILVAAIIGVPVLGFIAITAFTNEEIKYFEGIIFTVAALGLLFAGMKALTMIKSKDPLVTVNEQGIHSREPNGGGFILWEDIVGFIPYQLQGQHMLGIEVKDAGKYINNLRGSSKGIAYANMKTGFTPFSICLNNIENGDQLLAYLESLDSIDIYYQPETI